MLMSKLIGKRLKENPSYAMMDSHVFLLRGGYIRQISNGYFTLLTPAMRVIQKIEDIIRQEMAKISSQEMSFPDVDEDAIISILKSETKSYAEYPIMIYEIKKKLEKDASIYGGLIKSREYSIKNAYSFHRSKEELEKCFDKVADAYENIFKRIGLSAVLVDGSYGCEFMALNEKGEDMIISCPTCGYKSNIDSATSEITIHEVKDAPVEEVYTPGIKNIADLSKFLNLPEYKLLKATVFKQEESDNLLVVFIRGDYEVDPSKLRRFLKKEFYTYVSDGTYKLCWGSIGPYKPNETRIDMYCDVTLKDHNDLVCGANKYDYHFKGIDMNRDVHPEEYIDVYKVREGDICKFCKSPMEIQNSVKLASILDLEDEFSKKNDLTYLNESNELKNPFCLNYKLGIERIFACIAEENHDDRGIIWPKSIAPWQIHICVLSNKTEDNRSYGYDLYHRLSLKYEVLLDDRNLGAGIQFADADLIGVPVRIVISSRNIKNNEVEISTRDKSFNKLVKFEDVKREIDDLLN